MPQSWELARKIQLSPIESRLRAFHRAIDEPCALPLSHPKGGSKREFLHLALPFISSLQVIVDMLNLICGLNIAYLSLQMTNRPWNGRGHVTWPILNFQSPYDISETAIAIDFKFGVHVDHSKSQPTDDKLSLKGAWSLSRDLFNLFWKISGNISKMVRDSLIVSINLNRKSYALYRMVMLPVTLGDP